MVLPLKEWLWGVSSFNILILIDFQRFCPVFIDFSEIIEGYFSRNP